MAKGKSIQELRKELDELKKQKKNEEKRKELEKQIKEEKFKQSKLGKVVDSFGTIFEPKTDKKSVRTEDYKKEKRDPTQEINDVINRLPK